jgi:hypothetical protein
MCRSDLFSCFSSVESLEPKLSLTALNVGALMAAPAVSALQATHDDDDGGDPPPPPDGGDDPPIEYPPLPPSGPIGPG